MTNLLSKFTSEGLDEAQEFVPGSYILLESGIYDAQVDYAYLTESPYGSLGVVISLSLDGKTHRETVWFTNRNKENFYKSKAGTKAPLPGFSQINEFFQVLTGKPLSEQETEPKFVYVWNSELSKEVPTEVPMFTQVTGDSIKVAIQKVKEFKQEKKGDSYVPTSEIKELNRIAKVFDSETSKTATELKTDAEATYADAWANRWEGKILDKTASRNTTGTRPAQVGSEEKKVTKKLFG